ncbi:hypothetical protein COLO4_35280 [Corchorus olitorius]|uniref:Uncharacterized protein n=1 Tax=Corchorus olitorius TaxID=93759 RepID=A0A1R3GHG4_9ROSI|nr:hypothetical protein COLO4_35280 [Corchorus olitorius]
MTTLAPHLTHELLACTTIAVEASYGRCQL